MLRDEEIIDEITNAIVTELRIGIQAAAYTVYVQLTPNNKKPISQREFHREFKDNWKMFGDLHHEEFGED